jgi:heme exporter protein B
MKIFLALIGRDIRLALRQPADAALALLFFLLGGAIFPLGLGPEPLMLARIAPGVIWAMALFAALLSLDRLFHADFEDGTLDQLALLALPLWAVALAKTLAHWATLGLPLLLAAPLLAIGFGMPATALPVLLAGLALGGPLLSLIGAVGAALTLGARRSAAILPLLVLPLYVPVLVFGASALEAALLDLPARPALTMLAGLALAGLVLAPWATAAAIRHALE